MLNLNLSINELKLISKSRGTKGYKIMSQDASESVKKSEKNLDDTESIWNENYDLEKTLKATMPDSAKIN